MKTFFKNIVQNWKWSDFVFVSLFFVAYIIFISTSKTKFFPSICGILPLLCVISLSKKSLCGNILGIIFLGFYTIFLFNFGLYGGGITAITQIIIFIICSIFIAKKCQMPKQTFNRWDIITLSACLILIAYPFYLFLNVIYASYSIYETLIFTINFALVFLISKNVRCSKMLYIAMFALHLVTYILFTLNFEFSTTSFLFGVAFAFGYLIFNLVASYTKYRKSKQINTEY